MLDAVLFAELCPLVGIADTSAVIVELPVCDTPGISASCAMSPSPTIA
jgi:hypothetical protein